MLYPEILWYVWGGGGGVAPELAPPGFPRDKRRVQVAQIQQALKAVDELIDISKAAQNLGPKNGRSAKLRELNIHICAVDVYI